jgi:hypothetical protein
MEQPDLTEGFASEADYRTKCNFPSDRAFIEYVLRCAKNIRLLGLMTIEPNTDLTTLT